MQTTRNTSDSAKDPDEPQDALVDPQDAVAGARAGAGARVGADLDSAGPASLVDAAEAEARWTPPPSAMDILVQQQQMHRTPSPPPPPTDTGTGMRRDTAGLGDCTCRKTLTLCSAGMLVDAPCCLLCCCCVGGCFGLFDSCTVVASRWFDEDTPESAPGPERLFTTCSIQSYACLLATFCCCGCCLGCCGLASPCLAGMLDDEKNVGRILKNRVGSSTP